MGGFGIDDLKMYGPREEWPVGRLFGAASRLSGPVVWRIVERHGISPAGYFLLRLLIVEDGLRPGEVAKRLHVTPATITSVVDTLERNGHVRREPSHRDRRGVMLRITDAGRQLLAEKAEPIGRDLGRLYDVVGEEDVEAVRRFLLKLIERFENYSHDDCRLHGDDSHDDDLHDDDLHDNDLHDSDDEEAEGDGA